MASRFQKKTTPKIPSILGTRPSLFNYQLLTNTGVPGLDHLLGGGLPLGTVTLIEDLPHDDDDGESGQNYGQLLIQYFLSEGFFHQHKLLLGQISASTAQLPAVVSNNATTTAQSKESDPSKMKIAWRYEGQTPKGEELMSKSSNHHFNLNKTIPQEALSSLMKSWCYEPHVTNVHNDLFTFISKISKPFEIDPKAPGHNILRIGLFELGNELMHSSKDNETALLTFMYRLRTLARHHLLVVMLTLSRDFYVHHEVNGVTHKKVVELSDFVIHLTSFNKSERQNGPFKDYHGLIELHKASPLNCLQNSSNYNNVKTKHLFKSLRTKFSISPMHLPPDEAEVAKASENLKNLDF